MIYRVLMLVALFLVASGTAFAQEADEEATQQDGRACSYNAGFAYGKEVAQSESRLGWGGVGACTGLLCNAPGCLYSTGHAYFGTSTLDTPPTSDCIESQSFLTGYRKGYAEEAKGRNAVSAFLGGTGGTVLNTLAIILLIPILFP